jgi:hypothetical protein
MAPAVARWRGGTYVPLNSRTSAVCGSEGTKREVQRVVAVINAAHSDIAASEAPIAENLA